MVVGPCARPVLGTHSCLWCITWVSTQVSLETKQDSALARLEVSLDRVCEKPMAEDQGRNLPPKLLAKLSAAEVRARTCPLSSWSHCLLQSSFWWDVPPFMWRSSPRAKQNHSINIPGFSLQIFLEDSL